MHRGAVLDYRQRTLFRGRGVLSLPCLMLTRGSLRSCAYSSLCIAARSTTETQGKESSFSSKTFSACSSSSPNVNLPLVEESGSKALARLLKAEKDRKNSGAPSRRSREGNGGAPLEVGTKSLWFPQQRLLWLPNSGGSHREAWRSSMRSERRTIQDHLLLRTEEDVPSGASPYQVMIVGCRSTAYLKRQLRLASEGRHGSGEEGSTPATTSSTSFCSAHFLILHHSLEVLLQLVDALLPFVAELNASPTAVTRLRVRFLRASELMFPLLFLFPLCSTDTMVFPMPVPFFSAAASYQRVLQHDSLSAMHPILRVRSSVSSPRGFVAFTDSEAHACFIAEEVEASKLMVPWVRKRTMEESSAALPTSPYSLWLPQRSGDKQGTTGDDQSVEEVELGLTRGGKRLECCAVAASKSGPTPPSVFAWLKEYKFSRRYYRSLYSTEATSKGVKDKTSDQELVF